MRADKRMTPEIFTAAEVALRLHIVDFFTLLAVRDSGNHT